MRFSDFKFTVRLFIVILAALWPPCVFGEEDAPKPRVAVIQFSNGTGVASYDAACKAATDTLALTLTELGRYRVQPKERSGSGEDALRAMAEEEQLDFVVYGQMSKSESGGIECVLSVFDRAKGKTALSQSRKAAGVLDIFDTTDDLVVSVLESMTGTRIGFGSIALTNSGEKGNYTVLVDGATAGEDLASLDKVLNGRRRVTIVQKRMLGDREIAKSSVEVKEGETAELTFAVPLLMDDEKRKVEDLRAAIEAGWDDAGSVGEIDAKTAELSSLFGDLSYSPKLSTYKDEATQLAGEWVLRKARLAIEGSAWEPKVELLDAAGAVYAGAKAYPDPPKIRQDFEEEARLVETLFELEAGKALGEGDLGKGLECYGNALMVSTRYLGGKRMTDYAYAMTMLQSFQDQAGAAAANPQGDRSLKTVFGDAIRAGQKFYGMKDQVAAGKVRALVASDFAKSLSVDGGDYADAPEAVEPAAETRTLSVQAKGEEKPIAVTAAAKARLLFVSDGFAPFGKVALGSAPGAIEVSVDLENSSFGLAGFPTSAEASPVVSLDGGDEVDLPHLFENVSSGNHTIRIPEIRAGSKLYVGLEENVTVEPGKRLVFERTLSVGHAKIYVDDIPPGSTLIIDGDEQVLVANPAGEMMFDGTVDAGTLKVEVSLSHKTWYNDDYLGINGTAIYSVKRLPLRYSLQKRSIRFRGKDSDWAGIDPIFTHSREIYKPKISGSQISGGCLCKDDKNLYIKFDSSNGKLGWVPACNRRLILIQGGRAAEFQVSAWDNGTLHTSTWDRNHQSYQVIGNGWYREGSSLLELQFPLSCISQYFDLSKPIRASLGFWTKTGTDNNETPPVDIIIGK